MLTHFQHNSIQPRFSNCISRDNGAVYFAVVLMGSCLGPAFGFIGGALQLGVWTEGDDKKPEGITSADPGWVGAWWIGFLVCGFASILCALPMFGFPKERFQCTSRYTYLGVQR